jgi:ribosomal protein S15P/S13E
MRMTRRKGLTDAQIVNLNRVLRRLAEDLERNKADLEAQRMAVEVADLVNELGECS